MASETLKPPLSEVLNESTQNFHCFLEERKFMAANGEEIRKSYSGRYIAILRNALLDSDADFSRLAERVYQRFGYTRIYMPFVGKRRIIRLPSPRRAG